MPKIASIATASPEHRISQTEAKSFTEALFSNAPELQKFMFIFDHAQVNERQFSVPQEWFTKPHDFTDTNQKYIESALSLSETAVLRLAKQCDLQPSDFDIIFFVSTTGLATPSLDAHLANRIKLNPHLKRVPIWGLGCAAGANAIARAHDYLLAYPTHRALILSVELCGLAFQLNDRSKSSLVSSAIFGDGAAACLMIGDQAPFPNSTEHLPNTLASYSTLYPNTLDVMGWEVTSEGLKVKLSRDIPTLVSTSLRKDVIDFLSANQLKINDINHFVPHPGGAKILDAYAESLSLPREKFDFAFDVLREHGNMSSATVLFILKRFLESSDSLSGYGLLSALGPGFSSELVLLQWNP